MQAALYGHLELTRHLVNFSDTLDLDINQADLDGRNALFYWLVQVHVIYVRPYIGMYIL